jgi:lysophospholipase L1-like esterase
MERVLLTPDSTPLHHAYTVSFVNQIAQWAAYAKPVIPVDVSRALVAIFIGINDISDSAKYTFPRNNVTNFPSFYAEIIGTEFEAIETIYEAGYRNYLFLNLPPLERTVCPFPSILQDGRLIPTAR